MNRFLSMKRLSILFLALFGVVTAGVLSFQHFQVDPDRECAESGQWYFADERRCVTPIYIPRITGRPEGVSRLDASEANIREVIEAEEKANRRRAAAAADTAAQRRTFEEGRPDL